jgi:flagellar basal-body rod protein FlgC
MSLSSSLHISASGLTAERLRLDVISNNIANVNTTRGADGQPYRRQFAVFSARQGQSGFAAALAAARGSSAPSSAGNGVEVTRIMPDIRRDFKMVYEPGHPDADTRGYVRYPNVEPVIEMVDMISATRAYEAGVTAINNAKEMQQRALEIGR